MSQTVHTWGSRNSRPVVKDCQMVWKVTGKRVLLRWQGYDGKSGRLAPAGGLHLKLSLGAHVILCISSTGKFGEYISLRTHQKDK